MMAFSIVKDRNTISFLMTGDFTGNEFIEVIHNIELLCEEYPSAGVLFETTGLKTLDFIIDLKDYDLYKKHKTRLKKIAITNAGKAFPIIAEQFVDFNKTVIKIFENYQIEEARKWLFN